MAKLTFEERVRWQANRWLDLAGLAAPLSEALRRPRPAAVSAGPRLAWNGLAFGALALVLGASLAVAVIRLDGLQLAGVVVGLLVAWITFQRVDWGLLALVFITYTSLSNVLIRDFGLPSIAQPLTLLVLGMTVVRWAVNREAPAVGWERPLIWLAAYGLVGGLALLYAAETARAADALENYVKDALSAVVVMLALRREDTLRAVVWALLLAGVLMGTISVFQQLTGTFENTYWGFGYANLTAGEIDGYRIGGPLGSANYYAQIMLMLIPLALDRLWNETAPRWRLLAGWAVLVCSLTVFFTFSRGGFVALLVVLAVMLALHPPKLSSLLNTALAGALMFYFVPANYTARLATLLDFLPGVGQTFQSDESFRGRASEMQAGLLMFLDHPLVGVGLGNYNANYQAYSTRLGLDPRRTDRSAHSLYLEIAAEKGLLGLTLFAVISYSALRGLLAARREFQRLGRPQLAGLAAAVMVSLLGYWVSALFLHDGYARYYWLMIGLAYGIRFVAQRLRDAQAAPVR